MCVRVCVRAYVRACVLSWSEVCVWCVRVYVLVRCVERACVSSRCEMYGACVRASCMGVRSDRLGLGQIDLS